MIKVIGVIPARFASTRFPGKPLAKIAGIEMIAWVVKGAKQSKLLSEVVVATDDARIAELAKASGAKAVMTDSNLPSGTDRIWAAIKDIDCDVAINIQGDEPLVQNEWIEKLVNPFLKDDSLEVSTLACKITAAELNSPNVVKVIRDQQNRAIYFSRFPIPFSRKEFSESENKLVMKHVGMYGYRKSFLKKFCAAPPADLELAESLEQLRAMYLGAKIEVNEIVTESLGVDTPEDIQRVEKILEQRKA